ncbi:serine hydrolase domain-containing protein [Microbacterium insulae]|uniref:Serine hydrolase domain-containing protein n=1 Tax=Microbacterium insulae TaxID=483014 RepID=A0ABW3AH96_9MICO
MTAVHGDWESSWTPVVERFAAAIDGERGGAALAVFRGTQPLVDVWAGTAHCRSGRLWERDTPTIAFSCTKAVIAALVAHAVDRGMIDYGAPVADYWPEFAARGKRFATVADVLSHRVGLPVLGRSLTPADVVDRERISAVLAAQHPSWPPGSAHAYHALTYGWLAATIIERATGRALEDHLAEVIGPRVAEPIWLRYPVELTELRARVDVGDRPNGEDRATGMERWLAGDVTAIDDPAVLATGIPGAGAVTTARSLALFASSMVDPTDPLLSPSVVQRATSEQTSGPSVAGEPPPWARWGMGFQLDSEWRRLLGPRSFGHDGFGGQLVAADPDSGLGLAFLTNDLRLDQDDRTKELVAAAVGVTAIDERARHDLQHVSEEIA